MRSPPTREERQKASPWSEITPTSVVPPPMSTTIDPNGSATGRPAPIAAAIGSSISETRSAPALVTASRIARRSTDVAPEGTQITTSGPRERRLGPPCALRMKCLIISSATSRSAITPARSGRMVFKLSGVLPSISLASSPTARTFRTPLIVSIATTEGSLATIPTPETYTTVLAVPRSIATPRDEKLNGERIFGPTPRSRKLLKAKGYVTGRERIVPLTGLNAGRGAAAANGESVNAAAHLNKSGGSSIARAFRRVTAGLVFQTRRKRFNSYQMLIAA